MKELIINKIEGKTQILLIENEELVEKYDENEDDKSIEGNIYVGKVQNILPGLQSAFINIGEGKNAFIHVKDILPKVDITKNEKNEEVPINKLIRPGDPIIVEIKKETLEHKGPKASTHVTIAGRFIVFMPKASFVTVSSKIEDKLEKERLKKLVEEILPENTGAIVRTNAEGLTEEIKKDAENCIKEWKEIEEKKIENYPIKIYSKGGILKKTITDLVDNNLSRIIVNNEEVEKEVNQIIKEINSNIKIEINSNCLELYSISKELKKFENRKIWLNCGGFITIDKTEALTAIDVNSGKFIGNKNLEETIMKVNLEAAKEISKQMRLRDISGIIIIDFIDMQKEDDKKKVINEIIENGKKDRSKIQVEEFTKLNLMELTRKHINSKTN